MSDWKIRFGTAGTSDSFAAQGYKSSLDVPEYTAKMGLNAFEYQCGRGVRLGLDKAAKMAALAGPKDILLSLIHISCRWHQTGCHSVWCTRSGYRLRWCRS